MAKTTLIMILCALSLQGCITDTLADAGVEVSPELQAMGIDPGTRHDLPCPQFTPYRKPFPPLQQPRR